MEPPLLLFNTVVDWPRSVVQQT